MPIHFQCGRSPKGRPGTPGPTINPIKGGIGLAIGATAVGFIVGLALPSTRVEDERIGPIADQVKDKARETGQEAIERGKQVAEQAAETVKD
jgi:hypothetical protein